MKDFLLDTIKRVATDVYQGDKQKALACYLGALRHAADTLSLDFYAAEKESYQIYLEDKHERGNNANGGAEAGSAGVGLQEVDR